MAKKISLDIPDDTYKKLQDFGASYNQDPKDIICGLLEAVGFESYGIKEFGKEYRVPVTFQNVIGDILEAGISSTKQLYNKVLEIVDAKGLYWFEDTGENEVDLEENSIRVVFQEYGDSPDLNVERLDFELAPGRKILSTQSMISAEKNTKRALNKLKKLVESFDYAAEFGESEVTMEIIDEEVDYWLLKIDFAAEILDDFPKVAIISKYVKKLFKKAGIQ
jgi:hypothetical protein